VEVVGAARHFRVHVGEEGIDERVVVGDGPSAAVVLAEYGDAHGDFPCEAGRRRCRLAHGLVHFGHLGGAWEGRGARGELGLELRQGREEGEERCQQVAAGDRRLGWTVHNETVWLVKKYGFDLC